MDYISQINSVKNYLVYAIILVLPEYYQIHADLVCQACISRFSNLLRCFRTPGAPIRKIPLYTGMLPCLVPLWPQIVQIRISFRSRSDLVLVADHSLDFLGWLSHFTGVHLVF